MTKIKRLIKRIFGESFYVSLINIKRNFKKRNYLFMENLRIFAKKIQMLRNKEYHDSINNTLNKLSEYKGKEYVIFHNPKYLGVSSATKELFDNNVPCLDIFYLKDVRKISKAIIDNGYKKVYFSAFCYNWMKVIKKVKKMNPSIEIKTYWHGSHSQILDYFGWNRNQEIFTLFREGYLKEMATCKLSLVPFYEYNNFKTIFLNNTVHFDGKKYESNVKNKKTKIGVYSANTDWRKNMMCQVAAVKLLNNAVIDMVPLNPSAKRLADTLDIEMEGLPKAIKREEILKRMAKNDINVYVTFSECAPMLPIESLEVGIPCITGNNHHFFKDTKLEKYLVINNETDVKEIKDKIQLCLKEKDTIIKLYRDWKKQNDLFTKKQVELFIGGDSNE